MEFKIYGSGGHASVLKDLIERKGFLFGGNFDDADPDLSYIFNVNDKSLLVIGVGNNETRANIAKKVKHKFGTLIHPLADVSPYASVEEGTVILSGAVVQAGAQIGKHCIINANVVIDHNAIVEDFVSIYPGSYIGGESIIRTGLTLSPHTIIERETIVEW